MRRTAVGLVALALAATGCSGTAGGAVRSLRILSDAIEATARAPRAYTYVDDSAAGRFEVVGERADDLLYGATLSVGGVAASQMIVADDALALRYVDPARTPDLSRLAAEDPNAASALAGGRWVIDYEAAPPLTAPQTREGAIETGRDPLLDAAYALEYVRRAIVDAQGITEFNPDDVQYNPNDDPFRDEVPPDGSGIARYDLTPPPLPRRSQRGTSGALPSTPTFRRMALFVRDGKLVRVLESIDIESQKDFRRARESGGPQYVLELLDAVRKGGTREPIRVRTMSLEIRQIGRPRNVQLPLDALTADLAPLVGERRGLVVAPASQPGSGDAVTGDDAPPGAPDPAAGS